MRHRWILVATGLLVAGQACGIPPRTEIEDSTRTSGPPLLVITIDDFVEIPRHWTPPPPEDRATELCNPGSRIIALIVDPLLVLDIRTGLAQFVSDLCLEGYSVVMESSRFIAAADLRAYLAELYVESGSRLHGSILIGDIPYAYQWVSMAFANPAIPPLEEEVISFQYYADLDGVFDRSLGYSSPGGHADSYDLHLGDIDWEQWIGVLPMYAGDYPDTADALNWYFEKNHAYRLGEYAIPRTFMQISEHFTATSIAEHDQILEDMQSGPYAWTPLSLDPGALLYFESPPAGMSVNDGYDDLQAGVADFVSAEAHGYWGGHGSLDIAWAESHAIRTVFFWSDGCAVGNLDHAENFLSSVLYSPLSLVLVAKGTTNNSGGMGTNSDGYFGHNIATAMASGASIGGAVKGHVNVPLIAPWDASREFHFATAIILGDPTLRLYL